jgi:hypothetical protein
MIEAGKGAQREVQEYWLNEGQALRYPLDRYASSAASTRRTGSRATPDGRDGAGAAVAPTFMLS